MSEHKKSLHEITAENLALMGEIWSLGGEISDELELELQMNEAQLSEKVDRYCNLIELIDSEESRLKARIEDFTRIMKVLTNKKAWLKAALQDTSDALGLGEMDGEEYRVRKVRSAPRVVVSVEADKLPDEYQRVTRSADKTKIKEALAGGLDIEGCRLERGYGIRISAARKA